MNRKIILFVLMMLFSFTLVSSIGITPGRTTINYEPGLTKEVQFSILNSEHKDMNVVFMIRGDLNQSVSLPQTTASISASEEIKSFSYTVNLPESMSTPGKHEVEIVALEMPEDDEEIASVGGAVAVVTQLNVFVPYPNKFLEAAVNVIEDSANQKMIFVMPIINRGKLDIVNARAKIDIYSGSGEILTSLSSDNEAVLSLERKELQAEWPIDVNPGRYEAIVTIIYDEEIATVKKEFNIGEMFLEIKEILVNDFSLGEIAKFNTLVENKWTSNLKDVYLNIIVYNNEGEIMADFKSPNYDIDSTTQKQMIAFWDTGGVREGTYEGKIILRYGEKETERKIQLKITDNAITVSGVTGNVIVKEKSAFNMTNILFILVIFLVGINVVWFLIVQRLMNKKKRK